MPDLYQRLQDKPVDRPQLAARIVHCQNATKDIIGDFKMSFSELARGWRELNHAREVFKEECEAKERELNERYPEEYTRVGGEGRDPRIVAEADAEMDEWVDRYERGSVVDDAESGAESESVQNGAESAETVQGGGYPERELQLAENEYRHIRRRRQQLSRSFRKEDRELARDGAKLRAHLDAVKAEWE
jgi:hypothetical protein